MRKVIGLVLMVAAIMLVVGTVAPAQIYLYNRTATAEVVNDQTGLISLMGTGPYASIITLDSDGKMAIDFNELPEADFAPFAQGPNPDGEFLLADVLAIHNSGPEAYDITLISDNPDVRFFTSSGNWWPVIAPTTSLTINDLPSGWTLTVGLYLDTRGLDEGDLVNANIQINADNP